MLIEKELMKEKKADTAGQSKKDREQKHKEAKEKKEAEKTEGVQKRNQWSS